MTAEVTSRPPKNRLVAGGAIFIIGFMAPLLIPVVTSSNLSTGWKTGLSGFLALGVPEIFMLIAAAILGKEGFSYLKSKLWSVIRPPEKVSPIRYRIGLVMFCLPIVFGWSQPYLENWIPVIETQRLYFALGGDIIFASSLFVLGGEFWDKLRALFVP